MRRSSNLFVPLSVITAYYGLFITGFFMFAQWFPNIRDYLPLDGMSNLLGSGADQFELVRTETRDLLDPLDSIRLFLAIIGTVVLMVPISWVYFITSRTKHVDASFVQTIVVLPIIVAGIAMIVQNSVALAFSLAGIVAAVRFRFTLDKPSHALYIFIAIGIGLGSGIAAQSVATVMSVTFTYATLVLWKLDYGRSLTSPFFSFLTRRGGGEANDD